jgi:cytochrome c-type biogenesis protein CcmF
MVGFGMLLAAWIVTTAFLSLKSQLASAQKGRMYARLRQLPRSHYGMLLAHLGVAVFIVGVTLVKGYEVETDVRMEVGDTSHLAGYTFQLMSIDDVRGPNYRATRGTIQITRDGNPVTTLKPEKRIYTVQQMPMTEAAIDAGFTRHLYVAMGESVGPKVWIVRLYYKPYVGWIWGGCLLMALGGLLAAMDRRYRIKARATAAQAAASRLKPSPAA